MHPSGEKTIPLKEAKEDPILKCFLQNFSAPRNRGAGYTPSLRPNTQRHGNWPLHNPQPASTPPSSTLQAGGVVVKKRAMSEEDDDSKDRGHQEKKVKVEKEDDAGQEEKKVEVEDARAKVEQVKVRVEDDHDVKDCEREEKKVLQRWAPTNSIMRRWISSANCCRDS
jgi:hypothetical protein